MVWRILNIPNIIRALRNDMVIQLCPGLIRDEMAQ